MRLSVRQWKSTASCDTDWSSLFIKMAWKSSFLRGIPFEREKLLKVFYKGNPLPSFFKADFVCYESVIVECKAQVSIGAAEDAQVINCLRITSLERAVLLNFGTPSLQYKRLVLSKK